MMDRSKLDALQRLSDEQLSELVRTAAAIAGIRPQTAEFAAKNPAFLREKLGKIDEKDLENAGKDLTPEQRRALEALLYGEGRQ